MSASASVGIRVFMVEDNPIDVHLLRLAFESQADWNVTLTVVEDGERAIQLLGASLTDSTRPDFVVLDLNLPKRDGAEVLRWIRSTSALQYLPVAIVSSSPMDIIRNRLVGAKVEANCYFVKPMEIEDFFGLGKKLRGCYQKSRPPEPV